MSNENMETLYRELIDESKHSTHGYWRVDDFRDWGKRALHLIDEICGVTNTYYTTFLRTHHEAVVIGVSDIRFGTHVSLCISILKSVYKEFGCDSN